jgi:hypothetical protein
MLPAYSDAFDRDPVGMKFKPTIMANLQLAGVALPIAKTIQGLVAVAVAILIWRCYRRNAGRLAAAALLVGTALATPHAFIYDLPIVAAAMALLIQERLVINPVFSLGEVVILILGFTFPLFMMMKMGQFARRQQTNPACARGPRRKVVDVRAKLGDDRRQEYDLTSSPEHQPRRWWPGAA